VINYQQTTDSSQTGMNFSDSGRFFVDPNHTSLKLENLEPFMHFRVQLKSFAEHNKDPWGKLYEESLEVENVTFQTRKNCSYSVQ